MVRVKKDWLLHKNVVSKYTGNDTYGCGAPIVDMGDITDKQALSLPRCPRCFKGEGFGMGVASAKGGRDGEANASHKATWEKRSGSASLPMEGWL